MKYAAIICDLFGTLVDNFSEEAFGRVLAEMAAALNVPSQAFVHAWGQTWVERATGKFPTLEANIEYIVGLLGVPISGEQLVEAVQIRIAFSRRMLVPRHDTLETLRELRSAGYKIGLISDCTAEVPLLWAETPFAQLIDVPVFSCSVGLKKPDPRIYQLACEHLGVQPQLCLFVGDGGSHELSGANAVGMDAILIRMPHEETYDAHRLEADEWRGSRVVTLKDILPFVDDRYNDDLHPHYTHS